MQKNKMGKHSIKNHKKIFIFALLLIILISSTNIVTIQSKQITNLTSYTKEITSDQLQKIINSEDNFVIIDLRTHEEYFNGHIPKAITVPYSKYGSDIIEELTVYKYQQIILYSTQDVVSSKVFDLLKENNFYKIHILIGGINSWVAKGLQIKKEDTCCKFIGNYPVMSDYPPLPKEVESSLIDTSSIKVDPSSLPSEFSWKNLDGKDWTTPARNQGMCGSCWAFSALGAMEASINIASDNPDTDIDLSEQYILSCLDKAGSCGGGHASSALHYIKDTGPDGNYINGVCKESCMVYQANDNVPCISKCNNWDYVDYSADGILWQLSDYGSGSFTPSNSEHRNTIKSWLIDKGPVSATMKINNAFGKWGDSHHDPNDYYKSTDSSYDGFHAVLIVGYKDDPGYWICKNSWGTSWGYQGFFNIKYGVLDIGLKASWCTTPFWDDPFDPNETYINVTYPNGGEDFTEGDDCHITWISEDIEGDVEIRYSTDGGNTYPVKIGEAPIEDGSYLWEIPEVNSSDCRIKITSLKYTMLFDESDESFRITPYDGSISLILPNGGEIFTEGEITEITWTSENIFGNVDLYYGIFTQIDSVDNYNYFIGTVSALNGSYSWNVPYADSSNCKIKIQSSDYKSILDTSDQNFTIRPLFLYHDTKLPQLKECSIAWGDYDNDEDLDIILAGDNNGEIITKIYQNQNGRFLDSNISLVGIKNCAVDWGDYDNDGDLDIAIAGDTGTKFITQIYKNDGLGSFEQIATNLIGVSDCSIEWGDYDNDKDLDLAIAGFNGVNSVSIIYENKDDDNFTLVDTNLIGVRNGQIIWGDYDNDGDLDILLTGENSGEQYVTKIYKNKNNIFSEVNKGIMNLFASSAEWGDYDNDGDLDVLISGEPYVYPTNTRSFKFILRQGGIFQLIKNFIQQIINRLKEIFNKPDYNNSDQPKIPYISLVYENNQNTFQKIDAELIGTSHSCVKWGDFNNDDKLDIVIAGKVKDGALTSLYYNDDNLFSNSISSFHGVYDCSIDVGDFDNDGDLDLIISGFDGEKCVTNLYENQINN